MRLLNWLGASLQRPSYWAAVHIPNPTWSSLRILGQSRLVSLSLFAPFIGYLILFNEHLVDLLKLVPEVLRPHTEDTQHSITLHRLYWVYFGLSALGVASFIFALRCPIEIKAFQSDRELIESEAAIVSSSRARRNLHMVVADFMRNAHEGQNRFGFWRMRSYPIEVEDFFNSVISSMTRKAIEKGELEYPPDNRIVSMMDDVIIDRVAEILHSGRRVDRALIRGVESLARGHTKDLNSLRYLGRDYAYPLARLLVVTFYTLGFALLFIPTVVTSWQIILRVLGN